MYIFILYGNIIVFIKIIIYTQLNIYIYKIFIINCSFVQESIKHVRKVRLHTSNFSSSLDFMDHLGSLLQRTSFFYFLLTNCHQHSTFKTSRSLTVWLIHRHLGHLLDRILSGLQLVDSSVNLLIFTHDQLN